MKRATIWIASSLLTISMFLGALAAQEPGPKVAPAQRPDTERPGSQPKTPSKEKAGEPSKVKDQEKKESAKAKTAADEEPVVTHHHIQLGGEELKYTATAGLMPIKDARGETEARIFFMAYTRDDAGSVASRPLLFSFNGGPGSSSVWLHLGSLGPRRVTTAEDPTIPAPPFKLVDNDATWLDRADLVFIDPVGTGYSRAARPELNAKFHSLKGDIDSVGEFIRMYLTRYDRWSSPLYVIGESYGTTRAAGLSGHLADHGIALSGVILVSCALDFQGIFFSTNNDQPYMNYIPSYTAAAWYHKKLPAELQRLGLKEVLKEVETWVDREYVTILARGDRLSDDERRQAANRLARYTGLKADDIEEHDLRIGMSHFNRELLKADRRSIGRFDARYKGIENRAPTDGRGPSHDPSYDAVLAPYTSTFNHYIRDDLGYKSDLPYYILGGGVGRWDFQTEMGYPSTTSQLRDALTQNPHMQVLICSGYFDLATPYRAVEHALAGLGLDPLLRKNISVEYYEAGHMMYLHGPSLHKLKRDGVALIDRALKK
jgi:carboxypeptidase C (cathepsin A)